MSIEAVQVGRSRSRRRSQVPETPAQSSPTTAPEGIEADPTYMFLRRLLGVVVGAEQALADYTAAWFAGRRAAELLTRASVLGMDAAALVTAFGAEPDRPATRASASA